MKPSEIRQSIREKRRQLNEEHRSAASRQICEAIAERADFRAARTVSVFLAFDGEPDLKPLIAMAWGRGQRLFLPVVRGRGQPMSFAAYDRSTKLVANRLGILEPDPSNVRFIDPTELDCVLTPLVAFDSRCHRIGVGGGFYDRTFAFTKATDITRPIKLIGVAFELQKIDAIKPQPWDVRLDVVVTENQTYQGAPTS